MCEGMSCPKCTSTPARAHACLRWGEQMAACIREGSHQLGACGRVGIPFRTHMTWMSQHVEPGSHEAAYQNTILAALDEARRKSLADAETAIEAAGDGRASAIANVRLHGHRERFKRFEQHDEAASKLELSGPDGGPMAVQAVQVTREQAVAALRDAARRDPQLAAQLRGEEEQDG